MTRERLPGVRTMDATKPIEPTMQVPGLDETAQRQAIKVLQNRLNSLIDLHLTLKHVHWNVVGRNFIAVHEMLDPQVDAVRDMSDTVAERIATLGGAPRGTPGYVASERSWSDYRLDRADSAEHLAALDISLDGVVGDHRRGLEILESVDAVSHGMLLDQTEQLEKIQWFVRAHLEDAGGHLAHEGARGEREAAERAREEANAG